MDNESEEEADLPGVKLLRVEAPRPAIALAVEDDDMAGEDYPEEVLPTVEVEAIPLAPCDGGEEEDEEVENEALMPRGTRQTKTFDQYGQAI